MAVTILSRIKSFIITRGVFACLGAILGAFFGAFTVYANVRFLNDALTTPSALDPARSELAVCVPLVLWHVLGLPIGGANYLPDLLSDAIPSRAPLHLAHLRGRCAVHMGHHALGGAHRGQHRARGRRALTVDYYGRYGIDACACAARGCVGGGGRERCGSGYRPEGCGSGCEGVRGGCSCTWLARSFVQHKYF
ncbi:hypothetical protein BV25DRAFT_1706827 [Artomyces pyxidatus]|uniref:Uncharacterized protein n=1 Tax=Artomyces pyxidatus TaxID=48021 RepID=A0ACB8T9H4_9AGAM|nr:hypothetical protein BV25DRAFT_1706827 [Artomyces pyxidatus]